MTTEQIPEVSAPEQELVASEAPSAKSSRNMQDLTTGPLTRHLLKTTSFMLVMMVFQTLYFLVDLYWVGRLGTDAIAGVGVAGNLTFIVLALSQMLGIGTTAVISHAVGRKDHKAAIDLFNQAQVLAMACGVLFLIVGLLVRVPYSRAMSADANTAVLSAQYLKWFIPAMGLQFFIVAMGAALRGIGNFKPGMVVSTTTVIINMVIAPFLIFGWLTGHAFGVAGAAMSTLIAVVIAVVWLTMYFLPKDSFLRFDVHDWKPRFELWKRILAIGLPAGFEFAMTLVYLLLVYALSRRFGPPAQAGFGVGMRILQSGIMPVIALGFAVAPVAGQNFGAKKAQRVKDTFRDGAYMGVAMMLAFSFICWLWGEQLVHVFSKDPRVIAVGSEYLRIIAFGFPASGLMFVASSMFQAMGNTIPSIITSGTRIILIAVPAVILSRQPGFQLDWIWYLSLFAGYMQFVAGMLLLRREFNKRLNFAPA
jgi:putative MATE family efflux protein